MAIAITPITARKPKLFEGIGHPSWLAIAAGIFLGIAFLSYGVLLGINIKMSDERAAVQAEVRTLEQEKRELEKELPKTERVAQQLTFLSELLASHPRGRNAFPLLEATVHPAIQIENISLSFSDQTATLILTAKTLEAQAEQVHFFQQATSLFKSVVASGISINEEKGTIGFQVTLGFQPGLLTIPERALEQKVIATGTPSL